VRGPDAAPGAVVRARGLEELWIHVGTACNLDCPFCLEGSRPGDDRLGRMTLADVRPLVDEAVLLGARRACFTGGEPFVAKDMVAILEYTATRVPCLVLTNGSAAVVRRLTQIRRLAGTAHPIGFRVSLDYPDEARHDAGRGAGNFRLALQSLRALHKAGFAISVARQVDDGEAEAAADARFRTLLAGEGLPAGIPVIAWPAYGRPGERPVPPAVAGDTDGSWGEAVGGKPLLCASTRMAVRQAGRTRIYACGLVDDDPGFDLGDSLAAAVTTPVRLTHHRCYSCTRYGSPVDPLE
jgi:hypothetical protein